ncbi:hypothetical protein OG225_17160 [Nocardia sp. NBC_01377]|uniref:hypothetical protein n=1 Tax=Nocardia sp. NBC_01377 TaxID=2903595 RepID=UPI003244F41D
MLIPFDDYPVHQTSLPLGQTGAGNPNHYDRFWFNGFREDLLFGIAFCNYPNKQITDGAFSVLVNGRQTSLHCSARMKADPTDMDLGPLRIEIVEPMRVNRVVVDSPEYDIRADLTYTATTEAIEEVHQTAFSGNRHLMDVTRATQWGTWTGVIEVGGTVIDLADGAHATKDRSWGARLSPGAKDAAPIAPAGTLFLWSPIHFDSECFHYLVFEDTDGFPRIHDAALVPKTTLTRRTVDGTAQPAAGRRIARVEHEISWLPGHRRARAAVLTPRTVDGESLGAIELEPLMCFQMKGLGYGHPVWGHGKWHGESAVAAESYEPARLDPLSFENLHVQQLVQATWNGRSGLGVLEQLAMGPLPRYGFREFLDGAGVATPETAASVGDTASADAAAN